MPRVGVRCAGLSMLVGRCAAWEGGGGGEGDVGGDDASEEPDVEDCCG